MYTTKTPQGREYSVYFNIVFHPFLSHFKNYLPHAHNWNIKPALLGLTNVHLTLPSSLETASVIYRDNIHLRAHLLCLPSIPDCCSRDVKVHSL